jgi:uncharacterized protein (TIGR02145 family)
MRKTILLFSVLAFLTVINQAQTVTDYDGNVYNTVTIGTQTWMKENLKVIHYRNGDSIPNVTADTTWFNLTTGAYCNYFNDTNNVSIYGRLYNWNAVNDSRNLCPIGWHIPTYYEWMTLFIYLGGDSSSGGKMKETGTIHWQSPNTGATNESGFTALPGGQRVCSAYFLDLSRWATFWSSSFDSISGAYFVSLHSYDSNFSFGSYPTNGGFSIRCLKDSTAQINEINYQDEMKIYPNPAIDMITIDYAKKQKIKMQVYNMIGECVLQRELSSGTNEINVSSLSKGLYIIKVLGSDWTVQRKLIKE